jgi:hypothetical protein
LSLLANGRACRARPLAIWERLHRKVIHLHLPGAPEGDRDAHLQNSGISTEVFGRASCL